MNRTKIDWVVNPDGKPGFTLMAAYAHNTPVWIKDNLEWPAELGTKPQKLPYLECQ